MLENNRAQIIETDWSEVPRNTKTPSSVGRILMARTRKVKTDDITYQEKEKEKEDKTNTSSETQPRSRSMYYINKANIDPDTNPSLIDFPDKDQDASSSKEVEECYRTR